MYDIRSELQKEVRSLEEGAPGLGKRFAEVLSKNLALSGYFRVLEPVAHIGHHLGHAPGMTAVTHQLKW